MPTKPERKKTKKHLHQPNKAGTYTVKKYVVWIVAAIIIIVIVGLIGLFARQPIKNNHYSDQAKSALLKEVRSMSEALNALGVSEEDKLTTNCMPAMDEQQQDTPSCRASINKYKLVGNSKQDKLTAVENGTKLDRALKAAGWTETRNAAPTFEDWFSQITSGKDWLPDEGAYKATDEASCLLDVTLAYSNPQPPAYNVNISCSSPK